jgi:predicted methyltransferase
MTLSKKLTGLLLVATTALALPGAATCADATAAIAAAVQSTGRPAEDREQDERRKPLEFLAFAGIAPGMQVLDAFAAGGYYTELLSRVVGEGGGVVAYNNPAYAKFAAKGIVARDAGHRLSNVRQLTVDVDRLELAPKSLDAVIFVMSYHDLYWRPDDGSWPPTDAAGMLATLHAALKPGGVVVVQDHVASPGGAVSEVVGRLHRIDPAVVKRDFAAAGFELEAESAMLAHPGDDHSKQVFDPDIRGRTDQFVMKFRRP